MNEVIIPMKLSTGENAEVEFSLLEDKKIKAVVKIWKDEPEAKVETNEFVFAGVAATGDATKLEATVEIKYLPDPLAFIATGCWASILVASKDGDTIKKLDGQLSPESQQKWLTFVKSAGFPVK